MSTILAAECSGTSIADLAGLGWPGVVALGFLLATGVAIVWLVTR